MSNRPSNVMPLTKAQILNGRNHTESVYISAINGYVRIRVLTSGEIAQAEAIEAGAIKLTMNADASSEDAMMESSKLDVDLKELHIAEHQANALIVAYGLSVPDGETWSTEDVNNISPPEAVTQIAKEVRRISKVKDGGAMLDQLNNFRNQSGGAADRDAAPVGDAVGSESDGIDGSAVGIPGPGDSGSAEPTAITGTE